jgi:RNA polymerase primary sigma factor
MVKVERKCRVNLEDDVLKAYTKKISQFRVLTSDEEKYYARLAQSGDRLSQKHLVQGNLKLVLTIAKKSIHKCNIPLIDLIQEGNLGLMVAVDKFNWKLGYKFSTYAGWWIKQAMFKAISEQGYCMKIPVYIQETLSRYKKTKAKLESKYNCEIKDDVVAKKIGIKEDKIDIFLNAFTKSISLESNFEQDSEKSLAFSEVIEDKKANLDEKVEHDELKRDLQDVLDMLETREKDVITMRFGLGEVLPKTLQEIGNIYEVTKECVRQIEKRAIRKLAEQKYTQDLLSCYVG